MNTIYNVALKIDLSLNEQTKCRDEESQSQNGKPHNVEIFHPKLDVDYLFKSRYHQLKGFIRKRVHCDEDAEDLAQTTYMEALTKAHNYQGSLALTSGFSGLRSTWSGTTGKRSEPPSRVGTNDSA